MERVDVTVYHLEMLTAPDRNPCELPDGLTVMHAFRPSTDYYRFLYNSIGQEYYWLTRRKMSDDELHDLLVDPLNEVHVLYANGNPAGMAELDHHKPHDVELLQFGLLPEFIGQGLGTIFLQWTIDYVWERCPKRFWLHTCTLDHERALPLYQKSGFVLFKDEQKRREL